MLNSKKKKRNERRATKRDSMNRNVQPHTYAGANIHVANEIVAKLRPAAMSSALWTISTGLNGNSILAHQPLGNAFVVAE